MLILPVYMLVICLSEQSWRKQMLLPCEIISAAVFRLLFLSIVIIFLPFKVNNKLHLPKALGRLIYWPWHWDLELSTQLNEKYQIRFLLHTSICYCIWKYPESCVVHPWVLNTRRNLETLFLEAEMQIKNSDRNTKQTAHNFTATYFTREK